MITGNQTPPLKPSPHLVQVANLTDLDSLLSDNDVVLVDFYADRCGPCKRLKPTIHQLADEYEGKAVIAAVNVDNAGDAAQKHGVNGIPDVRIFKGGEQQKAFVGARNKSDYKKVLDKLIAE